MKTIQIIAIMFLIWNQGKSRSTFEPEAAKASARGFIENKGQVRDQLGACRRDVSFSANLNGIVCHLRNSGFSYQLSRPLKWIKNTSMLNTAGLKKTRRDSIVGSHIIYRVDMELEGANLLKPQGREPLEGNSNFYLAGSTVNDVRSFSTVFFSNAYNGVDLRFSNHDGKLKYEFDVAPGANFKRICIRARGATKVTVSDDGFLLIHTPLGTISEEPPFVTQAGSQLKAKWNVAGDLISFDISGADPNKAMLIDPAVRLWGTYYGGSGDDNAWFVTTDKSSNVYMCGSTTSSSGAAIATSGAFQTVYAGGFNDAFIVKFNSAGVRQWATYFGSADIDFGLSCATDSIGNVFLTGSTSCTLSGQIVTPGCQQSFYGGGWLDVFLAKFNNAGQRLWSTYCGGLGYEESYGCATDRTGNVYIAGYTSSTGSSIASATAYQSSQAGMLDGFLVKYNSIGQRLWGTFYGDSLLDAAFSCCTDNSGNVYLGGVAESGSTMASAGAHQTVHGGGYDGFLAKFNSVGLRLWGTYYGGTGFDVAFSCAADTIGNIMLAGYSGSATGTVVATPGSHQPAYLGGQADGFLARFSTVGQRLWGTYYGGTGDDYGFACVVDRTGNSILVGQSNTSSGTTIATPGSHQPFYGGGTTDAFIARFSATGIRQWGSYYGGPGLEDTKACAIDNALELIYIAGVTDSLTSPAIATPGSHQPSLAGLEDAFLVQFSECGAVNLTPSSLLNICPNNSTTLTAAAQYSVSWYATATSTQVLATGTVFTTPVLSAGNYTYYAGVAGCTVNNVRTPLIVNVSLPVITVSNGSICPGKSFLITPSGASSYTFSSGSALVSPTVTTTYSITGTHSIGGCVSATPAVCQVAVLPLPQVAGYITPQPACVGDYVIAYGTGAISYTWSGGIYNGVSFPAYGAAVYTVTGTDIQGCSNSGTVALIVHPSPTISLVANPPVACPGTPLQLTASGGQYYNWSVTSSSASTITVVPLGQGPYYYYVSGTNSLGCIGYTSIIVNSSVPPTIIISSSKNEICAGESATLSAAGAISFTWNTTQIGPSITVSPSSSSIYFVVGSNGCTNVAVYTQIVNPCTVLPENNKFQFNIYPNPGTGLFHYDVPPNCTHFTVFDLAGKVIASGELLSELGVVDLTSAPSGIYLVILEGDIPRQLTKVIKE